MSTRESIKNDPIDRFFIRHTDEFLEWAGFRKMGDSFFILAGISEEGKYMPVNTKSRKRNAWELIIRSLIRFDEAVQAVIATEDLPVDISKALAAAGYRVYIAHDGGICRLRNKEEQK